MNFIIPENDEAVIIVPSDDALENYAADQGTTLEALLADKAAVKELIAVHMIAAPVNDPEAAKLIFADTADSEGTDPVGIVIGGTDGSKACCYETLDEVIVAAGEKKIILIGDVKLPVTDTFQCSNGVNLVFADEVMSKLGVNR